MGTMEQSKGCQRHCFNICYVAHHMLTQQGRLDRAPNLTYDIAAMANEAADICLMKITEKKSFKEGKSPTNPKVFFRNFSKIKPT